MHVFVQLAWTADHVIQLRRNASASCCRPAHGSALVGQAVGLPGRSEALFGCAQLHECRLYQSASAACLCSHDEPQPKDPLVLPSYLHHAV